MDDNHPFSLQSFFKCSVISFKEKRPRGGGGGYSGFQVTGMIEGIFVLGFFLGTKIWQVFFGVA